MSLICYCSSRENHLGASELTTLVVTQVWTMNQVHGWGRRQKTAKRSRAWTELVSQPSETVKSAIGRALVNSEDIVTIREEGKERKERKAFPSQVRTYTVKLDRWEQMVSEGGSIHSFAHAERKKLSRQKCNCRFDPCTWPRVRVHEKEPGEKSERRNVQELVVTATQHQH